MTSFIPPSVLAEDSLAGSTAPMHLIIGVDNIPKDHTKVDSLFGLSFTGDRHTEGYVIFCTTRVAYGEVYQWFLQQYVIPLINDVRASLMTMMILYLAL